MAAQGETLCSLLADGGNGRKYTVQSCWARSSGTTSLGSSYLVTLLCIFLFPVGSLQLSSALLSTCHR